MSKLLLALPGASRATNDYHDDLAQHTEMCSAMLHVIDFEDDTFISFLGPHSFCSILSLVVHPESMAMASKHHHPLPKANKAQMNPSDIIAHLILLPVAFFCWRHSRAISAAFIISFVAASFYLAHPIDWLRWFCAGLTGGIGIAVTLWRVWCRLASARWNHRWSNAFGFSAHYPLTPDILASLLIGSSVADFVSLEREAQGHPWGSLSFWQIAVSLLMIAICVLGKRTAQEEANRAAVRSSVSSVRASLESRKTSEL